MPNRLKPFLRFLPVLAGIVFLFLGASLRLYRLDLMEFNLDQVTALLTARFWAARGIAQIGQMSGSGVIMPPGFMYVLHPVVLVTADPIAAAAWVAFFNVAAIWLIYRLGCLLASPRAGAWAAGLFAVHPWLIRHARIIWPQSVLPFFILLFFIVIVRCVKTSKSTAVFWAPPLAAFIWMLHYSGYCVVAFFLIWFVVAALRKKVRWGAAGAGAGGSVILLFPHLWFLYHSRFFSLRQALSGNLGEAVPPGSGILLILRQLAQTAFAGGLGHLFLPFRFEAAPLSQTPLGAAQPFLNWIATASTVLAIVFSLAGFFALVRRGSFSREAAAWLGTAAVLPGLIYAGRGFQVPVHYYLIVVPAILVFAGAGLDAMAPLRTGGRVLAPVLGLAVIASGVTLWLSLVGYVDRNGGTAGFYGIAYCCQEAAAERILELRLRQENLDTHSTIDKSVGVIYLCDWLEKRKHAAQAWSPNRARLVDSLLYPAEKSREGEYNAGTAEMGPLKLWVRTEQ